MKTKSNYIFVALALLLACTDDEIAQRPFPRVITAEQVDHTATDAKFKGEITYSDVEIFDHGFLWAPITDPPTPAIRISLGKKIGIGTFDANCQGCLFDEGAYSVTAYAISASFNVHGNTVYFFPD